MSTPRISRGPMAAEVLERDYARISNQLWRDSRLHAKSKGIFGFLASHRDGFGVSPESIAAAMADGISAVKGALRELEEYGYLTRSQVRGADGLMGDTTYRITDMPSSEPVDGNRLAVSTCDDAENRRSEPVDGNPPADKPPADNRPHKKTIPSQKISSEEKTTSSSPPGPTEPPATPEPTDGGGGGSDLRSTAIHITASLDYCDQVPDKQQQAQVTTAVLAALEKGWSMRGLARYLFLDGYRPDNPVAFYLSKLSPKKLPGMEPAEPSVVPSRGGARGRVASAEEVNAVTLDSLFGRAQGSAHRPFQNYADQSVYDEPWTTPAPVRPPWCGELECCETDRMREVEDDKGFKFAKPCHKCHPDCARVA